MTQERRIDYHYSGEEQYQPSPEETVTDVNGQRNFPIDPSGRLCFPYIPSDDLVEVVNLAIDLERPLLLEGEPGCGKTRLAGAVAYEFGRKYLGESEDGETLWWPYYVWNVKSISRARDGLYQFDAVARLRDAQLVGSDPGKLESYLGPGETEKLKKRLKNRKEYREFGALGKALQEEQYRPIVLIDEIDKADSDFPNDLLLELDELRFEIPETDEKIPGSGKTAAKPIIIVTSNREKPLSGPFLRRCLYFHLAFPEESRLLDIIDKRFGALEHNQESLVEQAVEHFYEVKELLQNQPGSRSPGTSEFLEFLGALLKQPADKSHDDLQRLGDRLPLLGALLKTKADQDLYQAKFGKQRAGAEANG